MIPDDEPETIPAVMWLPQIAQAIAAHQAAQQADQVEEDDGEHWVQESLW